MEISSPGGVEDAPVCASSLGFDPDTGGLSAMMYRPDGRTYPSEMSANSKNLIVCGGTKTQPLHVHPPPTTTLPSKPAFRAAWSALLSNRTPAESYISICSKRVDTQQISKSA